MGRSVNEVLESVEIRVRSDMHDPASQFAIDEILDDLWRRKRVHARIRSREALLGFGRRSLEVATYRATDASIELLDGDFAREWAQLEERAQNAQKAFGSLLRSLAGSTKIDFAVAISKPLDQMRARAPIPGVDAHRDGKRMAGVLLEASGILDEIAAFAAAGRGRIGAVQNVGDVVKAEFVLVLAEAWKIITGRFPGASPLLDSNPFLRFAAAAWADVGGQVGQVAFAQSQLKTALSTMKASADWARDDFRPWWAEDWFRQR